MDDPAFRYPIWICAWKDVPGRFWAGGLDGGGGSIAVFTTEGRAMEYIAACGKTAEAEVVQIPDDASLVAALLRMNADGFSQVVVDGSGELGLAPKEFEITQLLARLTRR
jgi:hypothetical protein